MEIKKMTEDITGQYTLKIWNSRTGKGLVYTTCYKFDLEDRNIRQTLLLSLSKKYNECFDAVEYVINY